MISYLSQLSSKLSPVKRFVIPVSPKKSNDELISYPTRSRRHCYSPRRSWGMWAHCGSCTRWSWISTSWRRRHSCLSPCRIEAFLHHQWQSISSPLIVRPYLNGFLITAGTCKKCHKLDWRAQLAQTSSSFNVNLPPSIYVFFGEAGSCKFCFSFLHLDGICIHIL